VVLSTAEREQLAAIAADRNRPRKHVERVRIVLGSADRHRAQRVAQSIGVSQPTVWRWQQRFAESGVEGLLRDKTRKPDKAPITAETTARVVALTCTEAPHQATHWTGRAMATAIGISVGSVQRIWRAHKLRPHRLRTFKRPCDPSFATKLTDIVGCTPTRRPTPWCCRLTRRARSKRSTARSLDCRSSRGAGRP
jgi:transposase